MSRDPRTRRRTSSPRRGASRRAGGGIGGIIMGLLVGLIVGAVVAVGTAWYFTEETPFLPSPGITESADMDEPLALPGKPGDRPVEAQELDFYSMLPQDRERAGEQQAETEAASEAESVETPEVGPGQTLYLQVGAYSAASDAENVRANLALNGIESVSQRTELDDGRTVHRVRIGPFDSPDQMNAVRSRLASAGMTASVVRVNR